LNIFNGASITTKRAIFGKVHDVPGACLSLSRNILVAFWPDINPAYNIELQKQQVHDGDDD
jgi:hypothetical protein